VEGRVIDIKSLLGFSLTAQGFIRCVLKENTACSHHKTAMFYM